MKESTDEKLGRSLYGRLIRFIRDIRRVKRRVFGTSTPEWVRDMTSLLGNFNLVSALPTFVAILTVPNHFFQHVTRRGKPALPLSLSPVKLFLQSAAIVTLGLSLPGVGTILHPDGKDLKYIVLAILAIVICSMPVWLTLFSMMIETIFLVFSLFAFWASRFSLNYLIPSLMRRAWLEAGQRLMVLLLLLPIVYIMVSTYGDCTRCRLIIFSFRIDRLKYIWGCCYLAMAVFLFSCVGSLFLISCYSHLSDHICDLGGEAPPVALELGVFPFLLIIRVVIAAYAGMLEGASIYPRQRYYLKVSKQLTSYKEEYFRKEKRLEKRRQKSKLVDLSTHTYKPTKQRNSLLKKIEECLTETEKAELRLKRSPKILEAFRQERRAGLAHVEDLSPCFEDALDIGRANAILSLRDSLGD